jgi:PST family polysaccharide transporter
VPIVIVSSFAPILVGLHANNPALFECRLRQLYFALVWLALASSLVLSFGAPMIVEVLFGPQYTQAAQVLSIHAWANVAVFLGVASSQYLTIARLQKLSLFRTSLGLISNISLNLVLIPVHGAAGAAIATVISYFIATWSLLLFRSTRSHGIALIRAPFVTR